MKPAVFTRDNPCTKVHIWNCFRSGDKFVMVPVVNAQSIIGVNTPKYLLRERFAVAVSRASVDYYALTKEGAQWLTAGVKRHLELHPSDAEKLTEPVPGTALPSETRAPTVVVVRRRPR